MSLADLDELGPFEELIAFDMLIEYLMLRVVFQIFAVL